MSNNILCFKIELAALMTKYGVHIGFGCSPRSDLRGIHDEHLHVSDGENTEILSDDAYRCSAWNVGQSLEDLIL
jgi:hypothetical protein